MFKKPVKISAQNQLSGKDRKTMRNKLVQLFDEACVDKLMNINDKIISCKISGSKMIIYNGNDYPLFVDQSGKNDYFPSLYTVMAFEPLIKILDINEGVESYIYNGANLMWPGVKDFSGLGKFQKGQVVGIRSAKGDLIAVGLSGCSSKDLQSNQDGSGVAVQILHYLNDKLWQSGPKSKPQIIIKFQKPKLKQQKKQQQAKKQQKKSETKQPQIQKKGKKQQQPEQPKQKKKQQGKKEVKQKQDLKQKDKKKGKKQQSSEDENKKKESQKQQQSDDEADFGALVHSKKGGAKQQVRVEKKGPPKTFSDDEDNEKKAKKKQGKKQTKKKGKKQSDHQQEQNSQGQEKKQQKKQKGQMKQQQQKSTVSSKLMDQQFKQTFLNALKLSKVQGQLPIDSGRFFMDFMLLARPQGVKLQIKDTSYKKLGKFYQQMSKQKFIEFKHNKQKKGQQGASIVKIFWENQELKNYEPTILRMNQKQMQQKQQVLDSKKKLKLTQSLQVTNVYKLHPNFKSALYAKKVNYAPTQQEEKKMKKEQQQIKNLPQFYTQQQARALVQKYINEKLVTKKDKEKKQEKKIQKGDKQKSDKMINIDYKNNQYLADLLKKQIEEHQENAQRQKQPESGSQQEGKKGKKKQNIMRIDRGVLVNRIFKTCAPSYQMKDRQTGVESFNQGTFKGIQLVAQKSNNKNITKIIGLQTFIVAKDKDEADEQIHGFANALKQKFACSVNVQNLPGKNAGKEIIVHGNFINQLQQMFTGEYKLNDDYIQSQNKLDKKKKR